MVLSTSYDASKFNRMTVQNAIDNVASDSGEHL